MEAVEINVARDFGEKLGGRSKKLGPNSGESFYEEVLEPNYTLAEANNTKLHIYLDGTKGYGSSFLDESFGELYRKRGDKVIENIIFHTSFFDWIVTYIKEKVWVKK